MSAVFICYASEDRKIADAVCHHLEGRGLRCWMAPRDVKPGVEWPAQIAHAVESCAVFVLVFSRDCNQSTQTLREVTMAVDAGKIVVPVRIQDVKPSGSMRYLLSVPHWLDAMTPPLEGHLDRLADSVQAVMGTAEGAPSRLRRPREKQVESTRRRPVALISAAAGIMVLAAVGVWTVLRPPSEVQSAIGRALGWLEEHQDENGRWDADDFMKHDLEGEPCDGPGAPVHDVGLTGLALLAFLGDGNTMHSGPYKDVVKQGVLWLKDQQDDETGLFGTENSNEFIYNHAIATLAMVKAYGLSNDPLLRRNAQNGINYLEHHRNPYAVWRYQPRDGDNDTSVTGWCLMAYCSAQFFKLEVNTSALELCRNWFDEMTDPVTARCGYTDRGGQSSRQGDWEHDTRFPREKGECMTAVSLLCRFALGDNPQQDKLMTAQADRLLKKLPVWNAVDGSIDHYYWFYATNALRQMGQDWWKIWEKSLHTAVVKSQRSGDNYDGSWDPIGAWGHVGGRVYSTAILCLTLEAVDRESRLVH